MADAIHAEIDRLKKEDISDDELKMIKTRTKANLIRGLADNEGLATQLAIYQTRYGDWRELFRSVDRIDQVTKADIRRVANEVFVDTNRTVGIIENSSGTGGGAGAATGGRASNPAPPIREVRNETDNDSSADRSGCMPLRFTPTPRAAAQATNWQQVPIPPLPAFKPQQPKRIELSNGMVIFLQEDHELPLIDGTARIRGGSVNEPAAKTGLVDIYGEVWRTGGTKTQTGDQLDDFLEVRAAKVETGGGPDSTTISFSCLKADLDDVFKVFVDVLQNPEFRADKIDIAQKEEDDGISRRNDEVGEIAQREAVKLAYGADNPYARVPEYATVAAVTRQDLIDWHGKYVHPNNIILGISGDFDSAAMEARLRAAFDSWPKGPALPKNEIQIHSRQARLLSCSERRREPEHHPHGRRSAPRATIPTTTPSASSTKPSAADSPRACSTTSAPSADWLTAWAAASARTSAIPAFCRSPWAPRARAPFEAIQAARRRHRRSGQAAHHRRRNPARQRRHPQRLHLPPRLARQNSRRAHDLRVLRISARLARQVSGGNQEGHRRRRESRRRPNICTEINSRYWSSATPRNSTSRSRRSGAVKEIDITIPPPPGEKQDEDTAKPAASNPEGKALAAKVAAAMGGLPKLQSIKTMHVQHRRERRRQPRRIRWMSLSRFPTKCTSRCKRRRAR